MKFVKKYIERIQVERLFIFGKMQSIRVTVPHFNYVIDRNAHMYVIVIYNTFLIIG